jgi:hypothetical protein
MTDDKNTLEAPVQIGHQKIIKNISLKDKCEKTYETAG